MNTFYVMQTGVSTDDQRAPSVIQATKTTAEQTYAEELEDVLDDDIYTEIKQFLETDASPTTSAEQQTFLGTSPQDQQPPAPTETVDVLEHFDQAYQEYIAYLNQ